MEAKSGASRIDNYTYDVMPLRRRRDHALLLVFCLGLDFLLVLVLMTFGVFSVAGGFVVGQPV